LILPLQSQHSSRGAGSQTRSCWSKDFARPGCQSKLMIACAAEVIERETQVQLARAD